MNESFDPDRHDAVDGQIASKLQRRAASAVVDTAAAHRSVLAHAGQARRRRNALMSVGTTAVLVASGWALVTVRGGSDTVRLSEPDAPTTVEASTTAEASTSLAADTSAAPTTQTVDVRASISAEAQAELPTDEAPTTTEGSVPSTEVATLPTTGSTIVPSVVEHDDANGEDEGESDDAVTSTSTADTVSEPQLPSIPSVPPVPSPPTTDAPSPGTLVPAPTSTMPLPSTDPFTNTYFSAGGTITVSWDLSALSLVAVHAAVGFDGEVEIERSDRISVRFSSRSGADSRIDVRVVDGDVIVDDD